MSRFITLLLALFAAWPAGAAERFRAAPENGIPGVYAVVLADGVAARPGDAASKRPSVPAVAAALARDYGGRVGQVWEHALQGFVIELPEEQARKLAGDRRVLVVEQDSFIAASDVAVPPGECFDSLESGAHLRDTEDHPSNIPSTQTIDCPDPDSGPVDSDCFDNWGLDRIDQIDGNRNGSYTFANTGRNPEVTVHVYVLDTGVRGGHRQFHDGQQQSRVLHGATANELNQGEAGSTVIPSNGAPPTCADPTKTPTLAHGTHVAGIIAGRRWGVAKDVVVHSVTTNVCPFSNITQHARTWFTAGLNWIVQDVQSRRNAGDPYPAVVNWSGGNFTNALTNVSMRAAVEGALNARITVVQSAGNQVGSAARDACEVSFGAIFPDVIVVGATDSGDRRFSVPNCTTVDCGSNVGSCVDLWAPGVNILSSSILLDNDGSDLYCLLSGTSMAAPHVTGVAALYLEQHPYATPAEVERALRSAGTWSALLQSPPTADFSIGEHSDNVLLRLPAAGTTLDHPPAAAFSFQCSQMICTFNTTGTTAQAGIAQLHFSWGDGTTTTMQLNGTQTSSWIPEHTYSAMTSGLRATLRVTDAGGRTDRISARIFQGSAVDNSPPVAVFTSSCSDRTCTFTSSSRDDGGSISSYQWDFGDGGTQSGSAATVVSHTYAQGAGDQFAVTLRVSDKDPNDTTDNKWLTGTTIATIELSLTPPTALTATASGASVALQWTAAAGADGYKVERNVGSGGWVDGPVVNGGSTVTANDVPTAPNGVVLYRVRARFGGSYSEPSNHEVSYVGAFTDDPVLAAPPFTAVKAEHIIELRRAVNVLRAIGGAAAAYPPESLDVNALRGQPVRDEDFTTLMTALNAARSLPEVGLPSATFRTTPMPNTPILRTQIEDLRLPVK